MIDSPSPVKFFCWFVLSVCLSVSASVSLSLSVCLSLSSLSLPLLSLSPFSLSIPTSLSLPSLSPSSLPSLSTPALPLPLSSSLSLPPSLVLSLSPSLAVFPHLPYHTPLTPPPLPYTPHPTSPTIHPSLRLPYHTPLTPCTTYMSASGMSMLSQNRHNYRHSGIIVITIVISGFRPRIMLSPPVGLSRSSTTDLVGKGQLTCTFKQVKSVVYRITEDPNTQTVKKKANFDGTIQNMYTLKKKSG